MEPAVSASDFTLLYSPDIGRVEEVTAEPQQEASKPGRKRVRNPDNWRKKHVKRPGLRKNSPRYQIPDLVSRDCCKKKCLEQFSVLHLNKVRDDFEGLYYEQQNMYLNGLLKRHETKQSRGHSRKKPIFTTSGKKVGRPPAEESHFTFEYSIRNEKGVDVRVCQKSFCGVYGFGPKRLLILRRKSGDTGTSMEPDQRGKHGNHPVVGEEVKDLIREHIRSFPAKHSHYSRKDNSGRVYLSSELSIARLHKNFLQIHDPEYIQLEEENLRRKVSHQPLQKLRKPLASEHFYHDIFVTEFNIHFGIPRTDTCSTCDSLKLQIDQATTDSERALLEQQHSDHLSLAKAGYDTFRYDPEMSKKSWEVIQQTHACGSQVVSSSQ